MRKAQKKQTEDFLELLGQAHEEIKKQIAAEKFSMAAELLGQCQEGAIQLGELIEKTEGRACPVIALLEKYCEAVYQIYEEVLQSRQINADKIYKKLHGHWNTIAAGVRNEIKVRLEVVFLPYKASMWDSLESVWKAADEDPDCDAYVVPIPYYDKNPDGSFREMHYEGNQYPEYVPVTWYKEYDFEKRQPDITVIHNPYDECNYVTSVHPFFYSANLKKFTEELVYIPYFVLEELDPDNKRELEGMAHYCTVPGVIQADKVIVQSEAMRQAYINVMTKVTARQGYDRKYWENKILGLGSPKVDKVLRTRKEDLEIPSEWLKIIEKPDKSWKKIVFYNTSVTALLQNDEKMLQKMRYVFRIFKERQDEAALLWRPHPLVEATVSSMRPQLWKEYEKIVNKYREDGWGIYDDSAELDRAVILSDAYYGDRSSVAQIYLETGKDLLIQNISQLKGGERYLPQIIRINPDGDSLWFSAANYNGIFSAEITTGNTRLELSLDNELLEQYYLTGQALLWERYLIFTPCSARGIHIVDLDRKCEIEIDCSDIEDYLKDEIKFSHTVQWQNMVYYIPAMAKVIIGIDIEQKKAFVAKNLAEEYKTEFGTDYEYIANGSFCQDGKILYVALFQQPYFMRIDLETMHVAFVGLGGGISEYRTIIKDGDFLYLLTGDAEVIQIDADGQTRWREKAAIEKDRIQNFTDSFLFDGAVYFMSIQDSTVVRAEIQSHHVSVFTCEEEWGIKDTEKKLHFSHYAQDGKLYLASEKAVFCIVMETKEVRKITLTYSSEELETYFRLAEKKEINSGRILYESPHRDLQLLLEGRTDNAVKNDRKECGKEIFRRLIL